MNYYGIQTPEKSHQTSYIHWLARSERDAWNAFFTYPDREGTYTLFRSPLDEAIKAYKTIGYKAVKLKITII